MFDYSTVIHLHSTHSDGTGTVAEIAAAGQANGLDCVLLTDHDTLAARERGEEGWYGGTLLLAGVEVTPQGGDHMLAFGLDAAPPHKSRSPQEVRAAVAGAGGFGFLAHPFSKGSKIFSQSRIGRGMGASDFGEDFAGVELWSFVTDTGEQLSRYSDLLRFVFDPLSVVDHPPPENLAGWDRLCAERPVVAIGGLDAHQIGLRIAGKVPLRLMSYRRSFSHLRTHLLSERAMSGELEPDRETVFEALRLGRCYLAMDSLAPARGFSFEARRTGEVLPMGATAEAGAWTLEVHAPRPARLRLIRDGEILADEPGARILERRVRKAGVYRAEAWLQRRGRWHTWCLSNPVYLR